MRITDIRIKNYRAFYGEHHISLDKDGKNLMLYGENGSGKSSLFTALKDFFLSSTQKLNIVEENIFIPDSQKGTASIKLTLRESAESSSSTDFELTAANKEIISTDKSLIINANKVKGFFDYRSLLETHLNHTDSVNIFKILNENILPHAINRFNNNEIGNDWRAVNHFLRLRKGWRVVENLHNSTDTFSKGFKLLIQDIESNTNNYLQYFDKGIEVKIEYDACYYEATDGRVYGDEAILKIKYRGKPINKHQLFLNEARLSALAISLYLASIKVNPLSGTLKVLVLDDLLIGLDMSNRLSLLDILKNHFVDTSVNDRFQIIMTTYDKVWYELVRSYFGTEQWKFVEVYSKKLHGTDFEIPVIQQNLGYIDIAKRYLKDKDFKASAVYIRTEFERLVKIICDKQRIAVPYKKSQKDVTSEDFWGAIESQTNLDPTIIKEITIHRGVVMNPFSHYDLEKPEFEKELEQTIASIEKLQSQVNSIKKIKTLANLNDKIAKLESDLVEKQKVIDTLNAQLKVRS